MICEYASMSFESQLQEFRCNTLNESVFERYH